MSFLRWHYPDQVHGSANDRLPSQPGASKLPTYTVVPSIITQSSGGLQFMLCCFSRCVTLPVPRHIPGIPGDRPVRGDGGHRRQKSPRPLAQEALLHFRFQEQIEAGACQQQIGHRARITQFASPGAGIVGAGLQQAALFQVRTPVIVAEKVAAVDWTRQGSIIPEGRAAVI